MGDWCGRICCRVYGMTAGLRIQEFSAEKWGMVIAPISAGSIMNIEPVHVFLCIADILDVGTSFIRRSFVFFRDMLLKKNP